MQLGLVHLVTHALVVDRRIKIMPFRVAVIVPQGHHKFNVVGLLGDSSALIDRLKPCFSKYRVNHGRHVLSTGIQRLCVLVASFPLHRAHLALYGVK